MSKINSEALFMSWASEQEIRNAKATFEYETKYAQFYLENNNNIQTNAPWWLLREFIRIRRAEYQITSVLEAVNKYCPIAAHVSVLDKTKVAYTPDPYAGTSDKQLQTTLPKLLYKYCPYFTETYIQTLTAIHDSEINPIVKRFSGWDLTDLYIQGFDGLGACMSDKGKYYRNTHPTIAYHTDHISVMCQYNKDNKIIARSLVYENGKDKRYFRVYGNKTLKMYLEQNGYVSSNWVGVNFNTVKHGDFYLFPYLDAHNNRGNPSDCSIALIDDTIIGIDKTKLTSTNEFYNSISHGVTTAGKVALVSIDSDKLTLVDAITGIVYNKLNSPYVTKVVINGIEGYTAHLPDYYVSVANYYAPIDECMRVNKAYVDKLTAASMSLHKLDATLYPDDQDEYFTDSHVFITVSGKVVFYSDAVTVYNKELEKVYYHKSEVKPRQFVRTKDGIYVTKDTPYLLTTSKAKVVKGVHIYYTLVTGEHVIRRPKATKRCFGVDYHFANANEISSWFSNNKVRLLEESLQKPINREWARTLENYCSYSYHPPYNQHPTLSLLKLAHQHIVDIECKALLNAAIGELEAVEAPHYLHPLKESND